jgi:hypothetical protein
MGMPLLKGRDIADTDTPDSQRVVVVSKHLAEGIFGEENPIGQTVKIGWTDDIYEVIGVIDNARIEGVRSNVTWAMYTSAAQMEATYLWLPFGPRGTRSSSRTRSGTSSRTSIRRSCSRR